jgi:hypothetical protein
MYLTDVRHGAQSRPAVDERIAANSRRRGRHRRPSNRRSAADWLAEARARARSPHATWPLVARRAAICTCAVLLLAGLVGARRGYSRRRMESR